MSIGEGTYSYCFNFILKISIKFHKIFWIFKKRIAMSFFKRFLKDPKSQHIMNIPDSVLTASVKYIFFDVVGFTRERSVEAQVDIINFLNKITRASIINFSIPHEKLIVLPSGDGLCIALIEIPHPYDLPLLIALDILEKINTYNSEVIDEKRRFQIRIGLSENIDNLITDFNGRPNVAGAGINAARAIMENADGGQILISSNVFETLRHREKYGVEAFKEYSDKTKHGQNYNVYQYIKSGHIGLNIDPPSAFLVKKRIEPRLAKFQAYYFAHAILNEEFFLTKVDDPISNYSGTLLLYFMAKDSISESEASPYKIPQKETWFSDGCTLKDQYEYYKNINFTILSNFVQEIRKEYLHDFYYYFEGDVFYKKYVFISQKGREKLKKDWPDIWTQFFGQT